MGNKHQHTLINQSIWAINQEVNKAKGTKKLNENIATFYFFKFIVWKWHKLHERETCQGTSISMSGALLLVGALFGSILSGLTIFWKLTNFWDLKFNGF